MQSFADILHQVRGRTPRPRVALAPAQGRSLDIILQCDFITPVLIGSTNTIAAQLERRPAGSPPCEIHHASDDVSALQGALELVRQGSIDILMQGEISNTAFHDLVFSHASPVLSSGSILSSIAVLEYTPWHKLVMITDTLFNHAPSLKISVGILEDALAFARVIDIKRPRVAVLAPLEYVNISIPSTLHAAVLSKMGERAQFGYAVIDGPLDIDCAVSREAARRKRVTSKVSGNVDIFLVSDVESGFHFAQFVSLLGQMPMAVVVTGTNVPVILNMPFISSACKPVEIALAVLRLDDK